MSGEQELLASLEETVIAESVGLVVVDSVAALARNEFDRASLPQRQSRLSKQASLLKWLASVFSIPVVVTNHVSKHIASTTDVVPALGNTWSHAVNIRLVLAALSDTTSQLSVVKSPSAPPGLASCYAIGKAGVYPVTAESGPG